MSIRNQLGPVIPRLWVKKGWPQTFGGLGDVLEERLSVEEAREKDARKIRRNRLPMYDSVGDYDPVLRAHCRLDEEG